MNFIVRNLGWILLIVFFIFMLYLISGQNNNKNMNWSFSNTGSIVKSNIISSEKKIEENKKSAVEKYNSEKKLISGDVKVELEKSNERGIIDSIKNFLTLEKSNDENNISDEKLTSTWEVNEKLILKVDDEINTNNKDLVKNQEIKKTKETKKVEENKKDILKIEKKDLSVSEKIKEKIEQRNKEIHTVWVHSIALNNAYFTKKVWYAYKGDKLEQITNTNKYGCFNSEVLESKISKGKKGWTCIYYMEGHLNKMSKYTKQSINYYKQLKSKRIAKKVVQNKIKQSNLEKNTKIDRAEDGSIIITKDPHRVYEGPVYDTEVWSLYLVKVNSLKLNNNQKNILEPCTSKKCDILEQLTPIDEKGCFKVNVFNYTNKETKRGSVCQKYLR